MEEHFCLTIYIAPKPSPPPHAWEALERTPLPPRGHSPQDVSALLLEMELEGLGITGAVLGGSLDFKI